MMCACSVYDWLQMTCDLDGAVMLSVATGAFGGGDRRSGRAAPTLPSRGVVTGRPSLAQHSRRGAPCLFLPNSSYYVFSSLQQQE